LARRGLAWWQVVVAGAAVAAAVAAVWVTLEAHFLAHPGWLAAQKADLLLGPVFIGLYWLRRRPQSRFGPMLIAFGFVGAVYVLHSSSNPWLFSAGLAWETVIGLATFVLILTFPTGRLDGAAAKLIVLAVLRLSCRASSSICCCRRSVHRGRSRVAARCARRTPWPSRRSLPWRSICGRSSATRSSSSRWPRPLC
jgi:hypothetical protein